MRGILSALHALAVLGTLLGAVGGGFIVLGSFDASSAPQQAAGAAMGLAMAAIPYIIMRCISTALASAEAAEALQLQRETLDAIRRVRSESQGMIANALVIAVTCALCISTFAGVGAAQSVTDLPVKAKAGNWELRVGKDAMTDDVTCIINVKGKPGIQVDGETLGISYAKQGGATSYFYRVDDQPMSDIQLVDNISLSNAFILMPPKVFNDVIAGQRLRVRANTQLGGLVDTDLSLKGLRDLIEKRKGFGCPG